MILHGMSDIAGQASYAVKGLKEIGENATLTIWRKNKFGYAYDRCLNIGKKKLLYPWYAVKVFSYGFFAMFRYNTFHFHFGYSLFPYSYDLFLLKFLKKAFFMEFHGSDIRWVFNRERPEFLHIPQLPEFTKRQKKQALRIFKHIDTFILHDCELAEHFPVDGKNIYYVPLRVAIDKFVPSYPDTLCEKPLIVHAPSNPVAKGSKYIIQAIEALKNKYDFEFILVKDKTQDEAIAIYKKADIIVDQLFAGTYGVFSVETMALGKPVICYMTEKMRKNFPDELPLVNANINTIEKAIEGLLLDSGLRNRLGIAGRKYAEDFHDYRIIAKYLLQIYSGNCEKLTQKEAFYKIKALRDSRKD